MSTIFDGIREVLDFLEKEHEDPYFKEKLPAKLRAMQYYINQLECKELITILKRKVVNKVYVK